MIAPQVPADEDQRIEALRALNILDSDPDERFDILTRLAKRMFGVSISLVSLIDSNRQWFKSNQGLGISETPRNISFCGHAMLGDDVYVVPDTLKDERFCDNPLVTGSPKIRFYAGCPLTIANGCKLGTLCIIDQKPRDFSQEDRSILKDLASLVEREITAIQLATIDELTLISNRRGFLGLAGHALNICARNNQPATVLLFDLDNFKLINDFFGHEEGDRALIAFANIMRDIFRNSDVFGRIGGDEFVALLANTEGAEIDVSLNRFQHALSEYNQSAKRGYNLEYSVGFVESTIEPSITIEHLLNRADKLMYAQKEQKNA